MLAKGASWAWNRFRPRTGWLALALLAAALGCLVGGTLAVGWVPEEEMRAIVPAALWGFVLGSALAERPLSPLPAWILLTLYGLLTPVLWLAELWPPLTILLDGWPALRPYWLQNGALFLDRAGSWVAAVFGGGGSEETITLALIMALLAWFLAAYGAWSALRRGQPLSGLLPAGIALALNSYYGNASASWIAAFVGLSVMATAIFHYGHQAMSWEQRDIDFSPEIRAELIPIGGGVAVILFFLSLLIPAVPVSELARLLAQQPAVQQLEDGWNQAFGGARPPDGSGLGPGGPGGSGIMPRSYLLGNTPELAETVVMTATVTDRDGRPLSPAEITGRHWRALSYESYTGRGWTLSQEREETIAAGAPIPLPAAGAQKEVQQQVRWVFDERVIRYTFGFPLRFDQEVIARWRGLSDLVRVQGEGTTYAATTRLSVASPGALREAPVSDVPPAILARYTELPPTAPERVTALAAEVAGDLPTAYDQARALESFLRQYTYSLDVEPPPPGSDPVEYFLFESQQGYCDFYASSMVVMARSLGLPARMAVGFLAQPPNENGVQTIYQINAHSWAEVYFAGYGWVEFEPTAPFISPHAPVAASPEQIQSGAEIAPDLPVTPPPLPPQDPPSQTFDWRWVGVFALGVSAIGAGIWWWRKRSPVAADEVTAVYGRLRRRARQLGVPVSPHQTPAELAEALLGRLSQWSDHPRWVTGIRPLLAPIQRLTTLFMARQYGPHWDEGEAAAAEETAVALWRRLRRPLWLLRWMAWRDRRRP